MEKEAYSLADLSDLKKDLGSDIWHKIPYNQWLSTEKSSLEECMQILKSRDSISKMLEEVGLKIDNVRLTKLGISLKDFFDTVIGDNLPNCSER